VKSWLPRIGDAGEPRKGGLVCRRAMGFLLSLGVCEDVTIVEIVVESLKFRGGVGPVSRVSFWCHGRDRRVVLSELRGTSISGAGSTEVLKDGFPLPACT
jgi:hypothetical protein